MCHRAEDTVVHAKQFNHRTAHDDHQRRLLGIVGKHI
jgi:hypothetical protein